MTTGVIRFHQETFSHPFTHTHTHTKHNTRLREIKIGLEARSEKTNSIRVLFTISLSSFYLMRLVPVVSLECVYPTRGNAAGIAPRNSSTLIVLFLARRPFPLPPRPAYRIGDESLY